MGWLTAAEALSVLGVRPQTLYANVSRRRIRARSDPKDPRRSLYDEADVRKLAHNRLGPRRAESVASGAIEWGDPVLPSAICTVAHGRLWYRGQDAVELAQTRTLEEVSRLLWEDPGAEVASGSHRTSKRRTGPPGNNIATSKAALAGMFTAMAARAGQDPPSYGRSQAVLRKEALEVLGTLARSIVGSGSVAALHAQLAGTWLRKGATDVLRRALVLLADHELNASTFAVRVTISTGASLASGVLAGLATLSGPLHGQAAVGVAELVRVGRRQGVRTAVREWLACGRALSGFGHPLYPDGDVRAEALLGAFTVPAEYRELRAIVEELAGERPNIDFALAAMTARFRLPPESPLVLFAVARTVGWLAHAMEQASAGHLIRPRARYVGPPVGVASNVHRGAERNPPHRVQGYKP
ncbi:MAG TPA: citrate synthase [Steroidobacteraceae bacterium]|nr:citrate synthase [Steroidobacteraceae bacterium]